MEYRVRQVKYREVRRDTWRQVKYRVRQVEIGSDRWKQVKYRVRQVEYREELVQDWIRQLEMG